MPYIPAHLDYCLYELLKNAARATVETSREKSARRRVGGGQQQKRTLALSARGATMPSFSPSSSLSIFGPLPPIVVRICDAPGRAATFRISDQGGGIPEEQQEAVWRYGFTTAAAAREEASGVVSSSPSSSSSSSSSASSSSPSMMTMMMDAMMAEGGGANQASSALPHPSSSLSHSSRWRMGGLGFGLPLSRLYARYFGGDLRLVSMPGYGVDAFLTLEHLAGDWVEPADEHVPVRPSAAPRGGNAAGGNGNGNGGSGGKRGEGNKGGSSSSAATAASAPSNNGRRRGSSSAAVEKRGGSAEEAMPGAALP